MPRRNGFIEIVIPSPPSVGRSRPRTVELWLRSGVLLRLGHGADPAVLRALVVALAAVPRC
jgi:hypothetical protein